VLYWWRQEGRIWLILSSQYEGQDVPSAHVNDEWMLVHQQRCSLLKKKLTMDKTGKDHSEMSLDGVDSVFAV
jgi:hypothetical protein